MGDNSEAAGETEHPHLWACNYLQRFGEASDEDRRAMIDTILQTESSSSHGDMTLIDAVGSSQIFFPTQN